MFQFRRFPTYTYFIQCTLTEYCSAGFPHSEICGSKLMCSSPQLIAACHVLHRLLMPRHSPCALISLTFIEQPFSCSRHLELCRHQIWFIVVCVTLLKNYNRFHKFYFVTSLLLARNFLLASLFSFQGADTLTFFKVRLKCFLSKALQSNLAGGDNRDRTDGLLLARQALSQLSYTPSYLRGGGPKWTRTTDLTIISRAL